MMLGFLIGPVVGEVDGMEAVEELNQTGNVLFRIRLFVKTMTIAPTVSGSRCEVYRVPTRRVV